MKKAIVFAASLVLALAASIAYSASFQGDDATNFNANFDLTAGSNAMAVEPSGVTISKHYSWGNRYTTSSTSTRYSGDWRVTTTTTCYWDRQLLTLDIDGTRAFSNLPTGATRQAYCSSEEDWNK